MTVKRNGKRSCSSFSAVRNCFAFFYLNPGNENFYAVINSEIYVDKAGLIRYTNSVINTLQKYICVSRPRRFGKSTAANMLAAYYSRECDSKEMFSGYEIAESENFALCLNQYDTIFLNMQELYQGNILLVGINYDVKTKEHTCIIEKHVPER